MEHFAFPGNIDFAADDQGAFWCVYSSSVNQSLPSVNHEQFPMQMTHKHNKWFQILAQEDFPPKLLCSENANFKFSVNNEGEDVNKKPRSKRSIAFWSFLAKRNEGNADKKRQRNRRLESEALWSFYTVENPDFLVCRFLRRYIDQSLFQRCITARRIIFRRTAPGHICSLFLSFSKSGRGNNAKSAFQYTINNNIT